MAALLALRLLHGSALAIALGYRRDRIEYETSVRVHRRTNRSLGRSTRSRDTGRSVVRRSVEQRSTAGIHFCSQRHGTPSSH